MPVHYVSLNDVSNKYASLLNKRKTQSRYRELTAVERLSNQASLKIGSQTFLDFCSNDYLGLSDHPFLKERSIRYVEKFGTSSSASRLVTGSLTIHHNLEKQLSELYRREALIFNSGYQANITIIPALAGRQDMILSDKKCHNSILQGCRLSNAQHFRYQHNNIDHLEKLLIKNAGKKSGEIWVITESIFSMDGDIAPIESIIELCKKYGAKLYVDDAHSTGLYGKKGLGLGANYHEIDLLIATFGKAAGAFGAVALINENLKKYLINYCSGFIYTTALPPSVIGSVSAAFELIPEMNEERSRIFQNSEFLRSKLYELGYDTLDSRSQIVPVLTKSDDKAVQLSEKLKQNGIFISAIRPPTVPKGESRLRLTLTCRHKPDDINHLLKILQND